MDVRVLRWSTLRRILCLETFTAELLRMPSFFCFVLFVLSEVRISCPCAILALSSWSSTKILYTNCLIPLFQTSVGGRMTWLSALRSCEVSGASVEVSMYDVFLFCFQCKWKALTRYTKSHDWNPLTASLFVNVHVGFVRGVVLLNCAGGMNSKVSSKPTFWYGSCRPEHGDCRILAIMYSNILQKREFWRPQFCMRIPMIVLNREHVAWKQLFHFHLPFLFSGWKENVFILSFGIDWACEFC